MRKVETGKETDPQTHPLSRIEPGRSARHELYRPRPQHRSRSENAEPLEQLRRRDRGLADQIRRATNSLVLNIGEGNERTGWEGAYHFRVAAGSAGEIRAGLRLAITWSDLSPVEAQPIVDTVSSVIRILSKLTRRP